MERRDKNLEELGARLKAQQPMEPLRFPDIMPSSVKKTAVWDIWAEDIATAQDVERLLQLMFLNPEGRFCLFESDQCPRPAVLRRAFDGGLVRTVETQGHWYEHPLYPNNYIRISPNTEWDWEKEVLEVGQPLRRFEVVLTDVERRRRENDETAKAIIAATTPEKPKGRYAQIREHYNQHQVIYFVVAFVVGVAGLWLAL